MYVLNLGVRGLAHNHLSSLPLFLYPLNQSWRLLLLIRIDTTLIPFILRHGVKYFTFVDRNSWFATSSAIISKLSQQSFPQLNKTKDAYSYSLGSERSAVSKKHMFLQTVSGLPKVKMRQALIAKFPPQLVERINHQLTLLLAPPRETTGPLLYCPSKDIRAVKRSQVFAVLSSVSTRLSDRVPPGNHVLSNQLSAHASPKLFEPKWRNRQVESGSSCVFS